MLGSKSPSAACRLVVPWEPGADAASLTHGLASNTADCNKLNRLQEQILRSPHYFRKKPIQTLHRRGVTHEVGKATSAPWL